MLNILQWCIHFSFLNLGRRKIHSASDADASRSKESLELMIEKLIGCNEELCQRLKNLEDAFNARSTITKKLESMSLGSNADN